VLNAIVLRPLELAMIAILSHPPGYGYREHGWAVGEENQTRPGTSKYKF
jgi:hypothetical protein